MSGSSSSHSVGDARATDRLSIETISNLEWRATAGKFRDTSYRQCDSYIEEAARSVGAEVELVRITEGQQLIGLAAIRIKMVPLTNWGIAYASYAPLVMRNGAPFERNFCCCLDALCKEYVEKRRLVFRVIPPLRGGLVQGVQASSVVDRGFRPGLRQPRKTIVLDLKMPREEIRRGLDAKWRRSLVKSEKAGLRITRSVELNDFELFDDLFRECTSRKGFMPRQNVRFFKRAQLRASGEEKFVLHLAWFGEELIAGHLGSYLGETAVYLLGASNLKGRNLCAAFLLQWRAIEYAQLVGSSFYDLGGIDAQNNPGVYRFKRGLNGRALMEIGPYEIAPNALTGRMMRLVERAQSVIDKFKMAASESDQRG